MARIHYWQFLVNEEGQPIEAAQISVYLSSSTSAAIVFDREYGGTPTSSLPQTFTDQNGYFEFWIGDEGEGSNGYTNDTKFKITWAKVGVAAGSINYVDILPNINVGYPVDVTDATDTTLNKFISNYFGNRWNEHVKIDLSSVDPSSGLPIYTPPVHGLYRMQKGFGDELENKIIANADSFRWDTHREWYFNVAASGSGPHGIEPVNINDTNTTINKLVSNNLMNSITSQLGLIPLETFYDNGTQSGVYKIDMNNGKNQGIAIGGNVTIWFTGWTSASNYIHPLTLEIVSGGNFTVTLATSGFVSGSLYQAGSFLWSGGTSASLTSNGLDVIEFYTTNAGITVKAFQAGEDMQ